MVSLDRSVEGLLLPPLLKEAEQKPSWIWSSLLPVQEGLDRALIRHEIDQVWELIPLVDEKKVSQKYRLWGRFIYSISYEECRYLLTWYMMTTPIIAVKVNVILSGIGVIYAQGGEVPHWIWFYIIRKCVVFVVEWLFNSEGSLWNHLEIYLHSLLNNIQNS